MSWHAGEWVILHLFGHLNLYSVHIPRRLYHYVHLVKSKRFGA
jgi:hypothetical protein